MGKALDPLSNRVRLYSLYGCGHQFILVPTPKMGDRVLCRWCGPTEIVRVVTAWSLYCAPCQWGKNYGDDKAGAIRAGNKHLLRFPHHPVKLMHNGKPVELLTSDQQPIPGIADVKHIVTSP